MPADSLSLLDNVRLSNGSDGLKNYYHDLLQKDREKALEMINDQKLRFGTLFLLRSELLKTTSPDELNSLYIRALKITEELTGKRTARKEKTMRDRNEDTASVLRWMIRTGYHEDHLGKDYDQLMEHSAALLTISFGDTAVLPEIAEMIFARHKNGKLIHEVVWAFFEARCPESLTLIAQRLTSADKREVALAKRLLCFVPAISEYSGISGSNLYIRVLQWLQENRLFLYYTGESLHLCSLPRHYAVSWAAKYLCRPVSTTTGEPLLPLNDFEKELVLHFRELPEQLQQQLADFSHMLYRRNVYQWNTWMQLSLQAQADMAMHRMGGLA